MNFYASDAYKYPDTQANQPGLEVGSPPQLAEPSPSLEWPDASKPVWGIDQMVLEEKSRRGGSSGTVLGLSVGAFWGIIVLLCVLVAGGIGGGVGAGLASRRNTCSSAIVSSNATSPAASNSSASVESQICPAPATITATTTTTSTQSGSATTSSSSSSVSPAPSSHCISSTAFNGSSIHPLDASGNPIQLGAVQQTFQVLCNTNFPAGVDYSNAGVHDIMKMYQPDLMRCAAACAEYNAAYQGNADAGVGVGGGLCKAVSLIIAPGEFCYLKNGTGINDTSTSGGNRIDSASLE